MKKLMFAVSVVALLLLLPVLSGRAAESEAVREAVVIDLSEIPEGLGTGKVVDNATRMRYLSEVGAEIHITPEGVATVYAEAISYSSELTNLLVVAELQQLINGQWTTLRTYRYFTGDTYAIISETCSVSRGYYYRVVNTTTAYAGNDSETKVATTPSWNFYVPGT